MFRTLLFSTLVTVWSASVAIGEEAGRPYLGIIGENAANEVPSGPPGAVVKDVAPDSPAEKGGLKVGDRIVKINNDDLQSFEDLKDRVGKLHAKDKINLKVARGNEELDLTIELGDAADRPLAGPRRQLRRMLEENEAVDNGPIFEGPVPGQDLREMMKPRPMIGVQVQPIDDALRTHLNLGDVKGVVVADVVPGGPADKVGIKSEDVITKADDKEIADPAELQEIIQSKKKGDKVTLQVVRNGQASEKIVDVEERSPMGERLSLRMPNLGPLDERLEGLSQRLGNLEKRIEESLVEKGSAAKEKAKELEQDLARTTADRIDRLEKRLIEIEQNTEKAAQQAVKRLEDRVAELTKRLEELTIPKEPK
jgi:predicted metalloprotease with PDZ domain